MRRSRLPLLLLALAVSAGALTAGYTALVRPQHVLATAPGVVTQSSPSNGATNQSQTPTLSWLQPTGAIPGTTQYTVSIWDPSPSWGGHFLANLPATTSLSTTVPSSEQLLYGQTYQWNVNACNGSDCSGFNPTWFSFTVKAQPAATASGAIPTYVPNGDFTGNPTVSGTVPAWTGTATLTTTTAGATYVAAIASLTSSPFALDYASTGSLDWFRIGYRLSSGSSLSVAFNNGTSSTTVFTSSTGGGDPANTWLEKLFSIPNTAGSSGTLVLTGTSPYPDVAYVERADGPSARGVPRLGITLGREFPFPASATSPSGVDLVTGAYQTTQTDLALSGLSPYLPLTFTRAYANQAITAVAAGSSINQGPLGPKWSHNWQYRLQVLSAGNTVVLWTPGGGAYSFDWNSGTSSYLGTTGVNAELFPIDSTHWTLTSVLENVDYKFTVLSGMSTASLTSIVDRNGNTTTLAYDGSNRLSTVTDAGGRSLTLHYDTSNRISSVSDSASRSVSFSYDPTNGDLTTVTDVLSGTTTYTSNKHWLTQVSDPLSHLPVRNTYDQQARVTGQQDADGGSMTIAYASPAAGVTTYTDQRNKASTVYFDVDLRVTDVIDPLMNRVSETYGFDNTVSSLIRPLSRQSRFTYDASDNLATVTDAHNFTWSYTYDDQEDLLTATDPNNHAQTFTYDAGGNLKTAKDGLNHTWIYTVNGLGQTTGLTDPKSNSFTYGYNTAGDLASVSGAMSRTYGTNGVGNRTSMVDGSGTTSYSYTNSTRLDSVTFPGSKTESFGYDAAFRRTSLTYPGSTHQVTYGYNNRNLLTSVTDWNSQQTSYRYDAAGNLTGITWPTGVTTTDVYDDASRLTSVTHNRSGSMIASASYTLNAVGDRTANGATSYTYDLLDRLTGDGTNSYTYDPVGNRLTLTVGGTTTNYSYDAADRLTGTTNPTTTNTFDSNDNETARGSDTFGWDVENHLTSSTVGGTSTTYSYNGDGLRLTRTSGGTTTNYLWDVGRGLPRILDDGTYQYVYGIGPGPIERVALSGGTTHYFLADGLGSTLAIVDSSGTTAQTYTYDAFGKATPGMSFANEFTFAGQQTDPSGLQYLRARYMDPSTGRFMSHDSFRGFNDQRQSLNQFVYTTNDPILATDATGLCSNPFSCIVKGAQVVGEGIGDAANNYVNGVQSELSHPGSPPRCAAEASATGTTAGLATGAATLPFGPGSIVSGAVAAGVTAVGTYGICRVFGT